MLAVIDRELDAADLREDSWELGGMERFTYRRTHEFPVRAHAARTRARMRSRGTATARRKARSFNGSNRRGRGKQFKYLGPTWDVA
jgi:hypothetical protein